MKPHDMKDVYKGGYGDCFRATIASVLHTPHVDDVPHFGLQHSIWWETFQTWCATIGLEGRWEPALRYTPPGYYVLIGESPRCTERQHAVVATDRIIVHDPHPSRAGLLGDPLNTLSFVLADTEAFLDWRDRLYAGA